MISKKTSGDDIALVKPVPDKTIKQDAWRPGLPADADSPKFIPAVSPIVLESVTLLFTYGRNLEDEEVALPSINEMQTQVYFFPRFFAKER